LFFGTFTPSENLRANNMYICVSGTFFMHAYFYLPESNHLADIAEKTLNYYIKRFEDFLSPFEFEIQIFAHLRCKMFLRILPSIT
jgi:hypothetical protein